MSWKKYFPYSTPRKSQIKSIEFTLDNFKDKKYVILECPTGSGKSAIAMTLAKYYNSAYIITTQKILQSQYTRDYKDLANLWSKKNYICTARQNMSCELGLLINKSVGHSPCQCHYEADKNKFTNDSISLTNLPYFLHIAKYSPTFSQRRLLVIDEAHSLDSQLTDFSSLSIKRGDMEENDIEWISNGNIVHIKAWLKDSVSIKLTEKLKGKQSLLKAKHQQHGKSFSSKPEAFTLLKQIDNLEKYIESIESFIQNSLDLNEWVANKNHTDDEITIKPIFASKFSYSHLFKWGDRVLMMSGTILDKETFCKNNGIPLDQVAFLSLESEFHKDNRPILISTVGSMSFKNIDKTLPNMVKAINGIINDDQHKSVKGILHCHSFKISNYIEQHLKNKRLLFHTSDNKIEVYKKHLLSPEPTILVSPSMAEGVDLIDDLSRFQVILKIPFPYLGDEYIKTKMKRVKNWYEWNTVKTLIQSSGRSVRSEEDWSITYILDSDWEYFYNKNSKFFPQWYKEAIIKI